MRTGCMRSRSRFRQCLGVVDEQPRSNHARLELPMKIKPIKIGRSYGSVTVIADLGTRGKHGRRIVLGRCSCGNEKEFRLDHLKRKMNHSCGCKLGGRLARHGHTVGGKASRAYRTWVGIHTRCSNPNTKSYKNYGGRGIKVCSRWSIFENFYHDMGDPPDGLTLDRINNDDGYSPDNCRWADWVTQANNRRALSISRTGRIIT